MDFSGFHGTDLSNTLSIINEGFVPSIGNDHWIGDGVYFFLEGLSRTPETQAENWAIAQSWDNLYNKRRYNNFVVFEAEISVIDELCLDLRTADGIEVFEYFVNKFVEHIQKTRRNLNFVDGLIINLARNDGVLEFKVVIGNFFIKFTKERIERINLRTANCTICNVMESNSTIISYKVRKTGTIS
jgi:hypothetical protein